jgi:two-component system sensor histidine kinase YesM
MLRAVDAMAFDFVRNSSLRVKLFLGFSLVISIPFLIFLITNYYSAYSEAKDQSLAAARQSLNQTKSYLDLETESIRYATNFISSSDVVKEILVKRRSIYSENIGFWEDDSDKVTQIIYLSTNSQSIKDVHLYMKEGLASLEETEDYILLDGIRDEEWFSRIASGTNVVEWYAPGTIDSSERDSTINAVRRVFNNVDELIGLVRIDIDYDDMAGILKAATSIRNSSVTLVNSREEIICTSIEGDPSETQAIQEVLDAYPLSRIPVDSFDTIGFRNAKYLYGMQTINNTDWSLVYLIPYDGMMEFVYQSRNQMIVIYLLSIPLALLLAMLISSSILRRVKLLIMQMKRVEKGDLSQLEIPSGKDEIGQLLSNYNKMLAKLGELLEEEYALGKQIRNSEIKALQAQINPHFLYNTLDLINWMSIKKNAPEISQVVNYLSAYYKKSLSKGEDIVTIGDEIAHLQYYVMLHNIRFRDCVKLEIDVPDTIRALWIPKITLQPLVENAILHGIMEKPDEKGTVSIHGIMKDESITLRIDDDGVGIPEDVLPDILTGNKANTEHGYGIKNINERLRLFYGSGYDMIFTSQVGVGTSVELILPRHDEGKT